MTHFHCGDELIPILLPRHMRCVIERNCLKGLLSTPCAINASQKMPSDTPAKTSEMSVDIFDEVKLTISQVLKIPAEQLIPDTRIGDLGADSLDVIEVVFALEQKFRIDIPLRAKEASQLAASSAGSSDSGNLALMTLAGIASVVKERVDAKA
jgi:acyl carrier protein